MSIPYTSGNFALVRVVDHSIKYPFREYGGTGTIYILECIVNTADYAPLTVGTSNMTNATTAGVIALPSGWGNANARFCMDSEPVSISGGVSRFTRTFAEIPTTYSDYSSAVYTSPPAYSQKARVTEYSTINGNPTRTVKTSYASTPSRSYVVRVRLDYSYTITPASATVYTPEGFTTTNGTPSITAQSYAGFSVTEENDGGVTVATTGIATVIDGTKVDRWMGDIYQVVTAYRIP